MKRFTGFEHGMGIGGWLTNYKRFNVLPNDRRLCLTIGDMEHFATRLDELLQQENSDYQAKRYKGIFLDKLTVIVARDRLFDDWLASTGKLGGQRKVPRLANNRQFIDPMLKMNQL